jgi:hypothetical protein
MTEQETKKAIHSALSRCAGGPLGPNAADLFRVLGYDSDRTADTGGNPAAFMEFFPPDERFNAARALRDEWRAVDVLFQLTDDDIRRREQLALFDSAGKTVDNAVIESYLFLAFDLRGGAYSRAQLAAAAREINKLFAMPALILFRYGDLLTLAVINRRLHKRDSSRDVLEKVTLIRDIRAADPHRAHVEILHDLSLDRLAAAQGIANFVELHRAWSKTLDSSELNRRFFREVADWYFWAVGQVVFPAGAGPESTRNPTSVIRLLTRLIFVWFLKEKGLVPGDLFRKDRLDALLTWDDPQGSAYYKAILQNLFFATLNQEMDKPGAAAPKRRFRGRGKGGEQESRSRDSHYGIHNVYRYEDHFTDPAAALRLFATIPFLNGGLFECLDRPAEDLRVDGFSDRADNPLRVPDELFFGDERAVDLNAVYDTTGRGYRTRGLIHILDRYKFTITENTPIEEEIALDPELLGRVFENLLAAYNPETGTTARKATGSFYTPREIVNYMVDEALLAYLVTSDERRVTSDERRVNDHRPQTTDHRPLTTDPPTTEARLRDLLAYHDRPHGFSEAEVTRLIAAIDAADILDPACGSGAFPMGILHKLVFVLGKLDPGNARWKERQLAPLRRMLAEAESLDDATIRRQTVDDVARRIEAVETAFARNELDYGRKLYLIENCVYGVDIQPIAVQIAKLRCFISLVVDQRIDDDAPNRGVLPLPNLETKFVAANTLLGVERPRQMMLRDPAVAEVERALEDVRHRYFTARTPPTKARYRAEDEALRGRLGELLERSGMPAAATEKLARWNPYDQNAHADFFDPEWMFGLTDGFDIVIGNPPYVRQEKIRDQKPALQRRYASYTGTADLYVYFFEAAYNLLRPGGVLAYISSNKYFRAGYGRKLRELLGGRMRIRRLIDFGDAPVFTAIAYPSIIVAEKGAPDGSGPSGGTEPPDGAAPRVLNWEPGPPIDAFVEVLAERGFAMPQSALAADGWRLEGAGGLALLDKLRRAGTPLGEYVGGRFYYGIKTGLNEAFVVDRATRDRLIAEDPRSAELLKPFLRGRDVKRWRVEFADQYLIKIESSANKKHPWSGRADQEAERIFAATFPAVHRQLSLYRPGLIGRADQGQYFWELRACAYWEEFERPKIVYPDIAQSAEFAFDTDNNYLVNTLYLMPAADSWLLGLLNSSTLFWFYTQISNRIRGGFVRYIAQYVTQIPIARPKDTKQVQGLVNDILALKKVDPAADVSILEARIDALVYELYHLTDAEIALIEGQTAGAAGGPAAAEA